MPLFTVITPTYNRATLIGPTLESLLGQRYTDFDVVVIDDGSTDGTADVAEEYADRFASRLRVIRKANAGQSAARNAGIAVAAGEYCAFLDSDDLWFPWTLESMARCVTEHGRPAAIGTRSVYFNSAAGGLEDPSLSAVREEPFVAMRFADYLDFFDRRPPETFGAGFLVVRTDVLRKAGGFWETRHSSEDLDLGLRIGDAPGFVTLDAPTAFGQRTHGANISHDLARSMAGLRQVIVNERAGMYAGGNPRNHQRRKAITFLARALAMQAANEGDRTTGWWIYRQCLRWHLSLGRWKFLAGYPAVMAKKRLRGGR